MAYQGKESMSCLRNIGFDLRSFFRSIETRVYDILMTLNEASNPVARYSLATYDLCIFFD